MTTSIEEPNTAANKAAVAVKEPEKTGYVILRSVSQEGIDETWQIVATVPAASAQQAIRAHADTNPPNTPETYVAVPARSWRAVRLTTETRNVLKLEPMK